MKFDIVTFRKAQSSQSLLDAVNKSIADNGDVVALRAYENTNNELIVELTFGKSKNKNHLVSIHEFHDTNVILEQVNSKLESAELDSQAFPGVVHVGRGRAWAIVIIQSPNVSDTKAPIREPGKKQKKQ